MILYDIHTHQIKPNEEGCEVRCVLNTSPDEFVLQNEELPDVWFSCGVHPWNSMDASGKIDILRKIAKDDKIVAIGEVGLDKLKGPDLDIQVAVFRSQIELAISVDKPLIIHCVKAWDELIVLYKEYKADIPWIIHGYRGNAEQAKQLSKIGLKFSIGERFNAEALKHIPVDSLFCETDMSSVTISKVYRYICSEIGANICQFANLVNDNIGNYIKLLSK